MAIGQRLADRLPVTANSPDWKWSLSAGVWFSGASIIAIVGLYIMMGYFNVFVDPKAPFLASSLTGKLVTSSMIMIASGVTGALTWYFCVEPFTELQLRTRGGIAGAITAMITPTTFFLLAEFTEIGNTFFGFSNSISEKFWKSIMIGIIAVFYVGWVAVPVGFLAGYTFGKHRNRK